MIIMLAVMGIIPLTSLTLIMEIIFVLGVVVGIRLS